MREQLIDFLLCLSDMEYQKECWVKGNCPSGVQWDNFDLAVHFFFDDTDLASNAKIQIGYFLRDENEANLVRDLCNKIDIIFDEYGTELSDNEYINLPEWKEVLRAAKKAHSFISNR